MVRSGSSGAGEGERRRPAARASSDDPLVREVQWRLFRREDLPMRLRRLQRLEEVAHSERTEGQGRPDERDLSSPG